MRVALSPSVTLSTTSSSTSPWTVSSSVPVKSPLSQFSQLSSSLQSTLSIEDTDPDAVEADLLSLSDTDANRLCTSLTKAKLALQPFDLFDVKEENGLLWGQSKGTHQKAEEEGHYESLEDIRVEMLDKIASDINSGTAKSGETCDNTHDPPILPPKPPRLSPASGDSPPQEIDSPTKSCRLMILPCLLPTSRLPEALDFELVEARIFREGPANRRFVLYTIVVRRAAARSGNATEDGRNGPAAITMEKRYSDFDKLHRSLKRSVPPATLSSICIPPKRIFKNFDARTIAERSRAFETYLTQISNIAEARATTAFTSFFYGLDMCSAVDFLSRGQTVAALPLLHRCLSLAVVVAGGGHRHAFLALCCLSAAYNSLDEEAAALAHADAAVHWLQGYGWSTDEEGSISPWEKRKRKRTLEGPSDGIANSLSLFHSGFTYNILTVPLIRLTIRLRWKRGSDKRDLERVLDGILKEASFVQDDSSLYQAILNLRPEF